MMDSVALQAPDAMPHAFAEAWNARDADRLACLFDEDAEFVNVTGLWWHDREAIRKAHAYGLTRIFSRTELSVDTVRVKALTPDVTVVHAKVRLTGQTPVRGVENPGERTTIFSFVMYRGSEGWLCVSAHNTDVVRGVETHVLDEQGQLRPVSYRRPDTGE